MFGELGASAPAPVRVKPAQKPDTMVSMKAAVAATVSVAPVSTQKAGDLSPEAEAAYDRAYEAVMALTSEQIADTGKKLFPDNHYQRTAFHCWVKTVQNRNKKHINPRSYPPCLIGEPGEGKSAITYDFGDVMEAWLSELGGSYVEFRVVTRSLGSVNDITEILGIVHVDEEQQITKIFPDAWLPHGKDKKVFGLLFLDDFNRGDRAISGAIELVNQLRYNSFVLPDTFAVTAAVNPAGKGHRVNSTDKAQNTRFVPLVMATTHDSFIQVLANQGVSSVMLAYAMKMGKELLPTPAKHGILPEPRQLNKRNFTMICHLYDSMQHDDEVLTEVGFAMLGTSNLKDIRSLLNGEMPLDPQEILGVNTRERKQGVEGLEPKAAWPKAETRIQKYKDTNRQDILAVTMHRLVRHLNDPAFDLSDDQLDNVCAFFTALPKDLSATGLRKIILDSCPRQAYYRPKFTRHGASDAKNAGVFAKYMASVLSGARALVDREMAADED
jgi:hypothetical protein